ncbi:large neutral amino acids transporter small subunit 4-like [Apostichopus japonicus]|uniref:large neutral amino acids transporter small subunit 4-like n=1 Tax=Stichopus japonicus TaxID=307972 RepID=UPI003AB6D77A
MAPSMEQAEKRRFWLLGTMVLENLFFSAALFGWSSLLPILVTEGLFSNLCDYDNSTIDFNEDEQAFTEGDLVTTIIESVDENGRPIYETCSAQAERLNLALTVGLFLLSGLTFPIGMLMDKVGSRMLRMVGALMFMGSCFLFGYTTVEQSWLLFPAVALNGVGGILHTFTAFQIANLFPGKRSTVISINIGAYASAGVSFLICKLLYDSGISRQTIFLVLGLLEIFVIINCFFNVPTEPIPDPEDSKYEMHWNIFRTQHKVTGKQFYQMVSHVGRKLSVTDEQAEVAKQTMMRKGSTIHSSQVHLEIQFKPKTKSPTLLSSIFTPIYLLSLFVLSIAQLRLNIFIGSLNQVLNNLTGNDEEQVDMYTNIFGYMQMMGIIACPIIGLVMDYKIKEIIQKTKQHRKNSIYRKTSSANGFRREGSSSSTNGLIPNGDSNKSRHSSTTSTDSTDADGSKPPMGLRIRKLRNSSYAFGINAVLIVLFGIFALIPFLTIQLVTFILYCVIRGFVNAAACGLYAIMYPANQVGSLIGLQSLTAAVTALLQYPIFVLIERVLGNDPFYVDLVLLGLSIFCFALPIFMFTRSRNMRRDQIREENEPDQQTLLSRPSQIIAPQLTSVPEDDVFAPNGGFNSV